MLVVAASSPGETVMSGLHSARHRGPRWELGKKKNTNWQHLKGYAKSFLMK
jgi:hypothetical protein